MAESGVLAAYEDQKIWFTHRQILLDNATGGGDAFTGAYVSARVHGSAFEEAVRYAISAAVTTIEHDAFRRRELNHEMVLSAAENMNIKELKLC